MGTRERDEALVRAGWNDPHVMKTIAQHIAEVDKVHPAPTEVSSERAERDVAVQWSLTLRQVAAWVRTFPHPVSWLATATDLDKMANAVDAGGDADENCSVAMPPPSLVALPLASPVREMSEGLALVRKAAGRLRWQADMHGPLAIPEVLADKAELREMADAVDALARSERAAEERGAAWVLDLVDTDDEFTNGELRLGCSTCDGEGTVGIEGDATGEDSETCDDCSGSGNGRLMTAAEVCEEFRPAVDALPALSTPPRGPVAETGEASEHLVGVDAAVAGAKYVWTDADRRRLIRWDELAQHAVNGPRATPPPESVPSEAETGSCGICGCDVTTDPDTDEEDDDDPARGSVYMLPVTNGVYSTPTRTLLCEPCAFDMADRNSEAAEESDS
jgi:hypothetical protein